MCINLVTLVCINNDSKFSISAQDYTDTTYLRFLASNAEAGSIIGKGGSTISDFQSRSNARIQLSRNFEYFPGTSDRIIMVSGTYDEVLDAVELILTKLMNEVNYLNLDNIWLFRLLLLKTITFCQLVLC